MYVCRGGGGGGGSVTFPGKPTQKITHYGNITLASRRRDSPKNRLLLHSIFGLIQTTTIKLRFELLCQRRCGTVSIVLFVKGVQRGLRFINTQWCDKELHIMTLSCGPLLSRMVYSIRSHDSHGTIMISDGHWAIWHGCVLFSANLVVDMEVMYREIINPKSLANALYKRYSIKLIISMIQIVTGTPCFRRRSAYLFYVYNSDLNAKD